MNESANITVDSFGCVMSILPWSLADLAAANTSIGTKSTNEVLLFDFIQSPTIECI